MNLPLISVVIPAYNREKHIIETLQSLASQDYNNIECIVIDDGSIDDTEKVIYEYKEKSLFSNFVYKYQKNKGPSAARNHGISSSKGEYVCFLDSDDLFSNKKISIFVDLALKYPDIPFIFSGWSIFGESYPIEEKNTLPVWDYWKNIYLNQYFKKVDNKVYLTSNHRLFSAALLAQNIIAPSTVMIKASLFFEDSFCFNESLWGAEDIDFWHKIINHYDVLFCDDITTHIRFHDNQLMKQSLRLNLHAANARSTNYEKLHTDIGKSLRQRIKQRISENYYGAGYEFYQMRFYKEAPKYFKKSLSHFFTCRAFFYFLFSSMPVFFIDPIRNLVRWLRNIKNKH